MLIRRQEAPMLYWRKWLKEAAHLGLNPRWKNLYESPYTKDLGEARILLTNGPNKGIGKGVED